MNEIEADKDGWSRPSWSRTLNRSEYGEPLNDDRLASWADLFEKILIANRGEIAPADPARCRDMGIKTVVVHSRGRRRGEVRQARRRSGVASPPALGRQLSQHPAIISAADVTDAEAIHPGYGFLARTPTSPSAWKERFCLIGPTAETIRLMGDKVNALSRPWRKPAFPAFRAPGSASRGTGRSAEVGAQDRTIGIVKSAGGGGAAACGSCTPSRPQGAISVTRAEAESGRSATHRIPEKVLENPRHIEVQVLADTHNEVIYLGERDCSMQRRHQKIMEEAPAPEITAKVRARIGERCVEACRKIGYRSAGTFELPLREGEFFSSR